MLLQRLDDRVNIVRPWFDQYSFHLVKSVAELRKLVDICVARKLCSLDLETTGVDNRVYPDAYFEDGRTTRHGIRTVDRIAGVCISFDGQHGYYIPLSHEPEDSGNLPWDEAWDELTRLVENCRIIFHNAKFDQEFLLPVTGKEYWKIDEYEDTFLMAKVIHPIKSRPAGLKPLSKQHFGVDMIELEELFTQELREQLKREKRNTHNFAVLHPKEGLAYGCSDGIFTYKLNPVLQEKMSEGDRKIYALEKSFCNVLRELERNRVHIDVERLNQLAVECRHELERVGDIIRGIIESKTGRTGRWLTLNIGSTKQLSMALITDQEGLRLKPTAEMIEAEAAGGVFADSDSDDDDDDDGGGDEEQKQYSLKDEALKSLHQAYGSRLMTQREGVVDAMGKPKPESLFDLILEWRHYQKMNGSYVEKLVLAVDRNGDVRPMFNQMGTDTARLSSKAGKISDGYSGINFQGIPRDSDEDKPELFKQIRTVIIPRPGWVLVKLDYSGEELRVVTNLSGDKVWTKSFLYEDGDVHAITARTLFQKDTVNKDERNRGKRSNFAFIYGGGAGAIQRNVDGCGGMKCTMEDAQRHMDNLKKDVPELMGYVDHQKAFARKHKCIYTAYGRRIPVENIDSPVRALRSKAERCAINYTIQATSADVIKFAMCFVDKNLRQLGWKDRCRYVLTVHDEVVFEIKPEYLMEVIRKLDEWMTYPWKLPKAHGRPWVVPLLTEPGIDVNWKARYNYFEMVDGVPAKPADIAPDGTFKGKLKKGQYFADGRIYQEVPDFLQQWIRRIPPGKELEAAQAPSVGAITPAAEAQPAQLPQPAPVLVQVPAPSEGATMKLEVPPPAPARAPMAEPQKVSTDDISLDVSPTDEPMPDSGPPADDVDLGGDAPEFSIDDVKLPDPPPVTPAPPPAPTAPKAAPPPAPEIMPESVVRPAGQKNGKPSADYDPGKVLRWTYRAMLNEYNQRRLHAVFILCEGPTPIRVMSPNGQVLISEEDGFKVDARKFPVIAEMFGLGTAE